jgi:LacI family transcriptional regulator, gluconate utilization system Gnt-I transcriptional repressor
MLHATGVPVIEIWDLPAKPIGYAVGFSNVEAAKAMVRHLAASGYRRIAFVGETDDAGIRDSRRRDGFVSAMTELKLPAHRKHRYARPPVGMTEGRAAFGHVINRWSDTDAIFCVSEPCAYGVMVEAVAQGFDVPGRIGIAGFGDFEIGRCSEPSLTTVGIDAPALGRATGELLRRIQEGMVGEHIITLPIAMLARSSTVRL